MKVYEKNIFDLELLQEPIMESLKGAGSTDEKWISGVAEYFREKILNEIKTKEGINKNCTQECSFNVEVFDMWLKGRIQFLLIKLTSYNIFQAIGYDMELNIRSEGVNLRRIQWEHFQEHPIVEVYWNANEKKAKGRVDLPLAGRTPLQNRTCGFPASGSLQS